MNNSLRAIALTAAACVVVMIGIFIVTGVGQDPLQFVHSVDEYYRLLLVRPSALRATLGFDNVFIVCYATLFILLAGELLRLGASARLVNVALGFLLATALLDMAENFHFLVMLARAVGGERPGAFEIGAQVWESLLKFHVSYLGLFLLGLALPRRTAADRALAFLCVFVQAPAGIAIYVTPRELAVPLVFVRFTFFLASLALIAWSFAPSAAGSDARGEFPNTTPGVAG